MRKGAIGVFLLLMLVGRATGAIACVVGGDVTTVVLDDTPFSKERVYAVTVPGSAIGKDSPGRTNVYKVGPVKETLLFSLPWFDDSIHLKSGKLADTKTGVSIVRFKGWFYTKETSDKQIGMEFYLDGKLVKKYLVKDIAPTKKDYLGGNCGYTTFYDDSVKPEYKWIDAGNGREGRYVYEITFFHRIVDFDLTTGKMFEERPYSSPLLIYQQ